MSYRNEALKYYGIQKTARGGLAGLLMNATESFDISVCEELARICQSLPTCTGARAVDNQVLFEMDGEKCKITFGAVGCDNLQMANKCMGGVLVYCKGEKFQSSKIPFSAHDNPKNVAKSVFKQLPKHLWA